MKIFERGLKKLEEGKKKKIGWERVIEGESRKVGKRLGGSWGKSGLKLAKLSVLKNS